MENGKSKEVEKVGVIDWGEFETNFVSLVEGEPKTLMLCGWTQVCREFDGRSRIGLKMICVEEDGIDLRDCPKVFSTYSKRLILGLKPFIVAADKGGVDRVCVRVTKVGKGTDTHYSVKGV